MSTTEIKESLAGMSRPERDDVKAFLHSLEQDDLVLTPKEIKELDLRMKHYISDPGSAKPWKEVVGQWKKQ